MKNDFIFQRFMIQKNALKESQPVSKAEMEGASSINPNVYLRPQENENDEDIKMVPVLKSQLPPFFCLDLLFKYALYDEACKFLYYRRENNDLLQMIRWEYEENKNQSEQMKKKIYKLKQT